MAAYAASTTVVTVTDRAGQPIAGARVELTTNPVERVTSDNRGRAQLRLPASGTYTLRVEASGFKTAVRSLQAADQKVISITLAPSAGALQVIGSVTGHARTPFNATPTAARVFPREAYRDQGQPFAATILDQTPGALALTATNTNAGAALPPSFPSVRNALPFETPVSIDGEPILAPLGTLDLSLMPSFMLQEVEIVKGAGDAGGSGGVGGAINFRTADPTLGERGTYEIEGDDHGGSFTDLAYDGTEPGGALAYATMLAADDSPCCGPDPSDYSRKDMLVKLRSTPGGGLTVTATGMSVALDRSLDAVYGVPGYGYEHLGFGDVSAALDRGDDAYSAHLYTAQTDEDPYASAGPLLPNAESENGLSLGWLHTSGTLAFDSSAGVVSGAVSGTTAAETRSSARESITYRPTARSEWDLSGDLASDRTTSASFDAPSGRVGYAYTISDGLALRASYGSSGILPPLATLPGILPTHSDIDSTERATGTDAGIEWRMHGATTTLSADVYRNSTQGAYWLDQDTWTNGPPMVESGEEFTLQQFKRVGMGFIAALSFPRTYVWGGAPSPVLTAANIGYGEIAPFRIPYAQGYTELSYKWPRGSRASIGALYVGSNNAYGSPAFFTLNSNLELSLGSKAKLQFSAQNLTNTLAGRVPLYQPVGSYGLQPFTLRFMFRQSFGSGSLYEH